MSVGQIVSRLVHSPNKVIQAETFEHIAKQATELNSKFKVLNDQTNITIYKDDVMLYYSVEISIDKEQYIQRNCNSFFSTEPITPKEHLRMQQLLEREKRDRCMFCMQFNDVGATIEMFGIDVNMPLYIFLSNM